MDIHGVCRNRLRQSYISWRRAPVSKLLMLASKFIEVPVSRDGGLAELLLLPEPDPLLRSCRLRFASSLWAPSTTDTATAAASASSRTRIAVRRNDIILKELPNLSAPTSSPNSKPQKTHQASQTDCSKAQILCELQIWCNIYRSTQLHLHYRLARNWTPQLKSNETLQSRRTVHTVC